MNSPLFSYLKDKDISETQVQMTIHTFDRFAKEYAEKNEWNPKTIIEIKKYNIEPFVKFANKNENTLIVGCQTDRDFDLLREKGLICIGANPSFGMLTEALKRVPEGIFIHSDPRSLPFMPESFGNVYADALTEIPKQDIKKVLHDFHVFLKPNGILYLSLRLGSQNVMLMNDLGGKRFLTLFRKEEISLMLKNANFKLLWSKISSHTNPTLPKWHSLIAKKE